MALHAEGGVPAETERNRETAEEKASPPAESAAVPESGRLARLRRPHAGGRYLKASDPLVYVDLMLAVGT